MHFLLLPLFFVLWTLSATAEKPAMTFVVETITAKEEPFSFKRRYIGTITTESFSLLKPQASGTIDEIKVKPEQAVKKGQQLFSLDNSSEKARVKIDQKHVELAKKSWARHKKLFATGDISKAELDRDHSALLQAEQKLGESLSALKNSEIRAPFDGIVGVPRVVLGQSVTPSDTLISIRDGAFLLTFSVPASRLAELELGQMVMVNKEQAPITAIERSIDPSTRTGFAKVALKQCPKCVVGSSVFAEVSIKETPKAILLNKEAIFYQRGKPFIVLVKSNDKKELSAEEQEVVLGYEQNGMVEIVSGVKSGDIVVKLNPKRIHKGAKVRISS